MSDTKDEPDNRPLGTIKEVWREYLGWSHTSGTLKKKDSRARNLASLLALGGAALGTLSVQLSPENAVEGFSVSSASGVASAALIALATYIGRKTLSPDNELLWTRARSLAEALKRQAWLGLLRVPPYDGPDAAEALLQRVDQLRSNTAVKNIELRPELGETPVLPQADQVDDYIRLRVEDQIGWYGRRAGEFANKVAFWKRSSSALGVVAAALGLSVFSNYGVVAWVPVLTTAAAAIVSFLNAGRYQALIPMYRDTERQLRYRLARWHDLPASDKTRDEDNRLVEDCENIMASENQSWRAEWQSQPNEAES